MAEHAEEKVQIATEEATFWKDRFIKLAWLANQAIMDIPRSLLMAEGMVDLFKTPYEISQFLELCKRNVHPYGMPLEWNANTREQSVLEGHEQAGMNNPGVGPTQSSGTGPALTLGDGPYTQPVEAHPLVDPNWQTGPTSGIQKTTPPGEEKLSLLEERL
ncbi:hypothetical protein CR513_04818, partial [Mucuna pruriens]